MVCKYYTKNNSQLTESCLMAIVGVKDVQYIMSGKWEYSIVAALFYLILAIFFFIVKIELNPGVIFLILSVGKFLFTERPSNKL